MYDISKITAAVLGLASTAIAASPKQLEPRKAPPQNAYSGQATTYGGNTAGGTCSFSTYKIPSGLYGVALTDSIWDNAYNCGGCVEVKSGRKKIKAMIVDQCPGCGPGHLDLFPDAYKVFSGNPGIIDVNWQFVPCDEVKGPLRIHLKEGVSEYWFSAQVVNARRRTKKMEYRAPGGKWTNIPQREDYNFFQASSGVGSKTVDIRVTSHVGTQVIVKNVPAEGGKEVKGQGNYK